MSDREPRTTFIRTWRHFAALLALMVTSCLQQTHAGIRAVLIGVNDYRDAGIQDLSGAENDVLNLEEVLLREFRVPDEHVVVLLGKEATYRRVTEALRQLAPAPEDIVLVHFSGHGASIADNNNDEADDYDEALCPFDTVKNNGDNVLRDDDLGKLLDQLICQEVVVLLDCCHSGTGTKALQASPVIDGLPEYRIRSVVLGNGRQLWKKSLDEETARAAVAKATGLRGIRQPLGRDIRNPAAKHRRIVLSACSASERAIEVHHRDVLWGFYTGSLTHHLVEGLRGPADTSGDGTVSYEEAYRYARHRIREQLPGPYTADWLNQTPVLDAPAESRSRPFLDAPTRYPMHARASFDALNRSRVFIDLGAIHGIRTGQVLGLFPGIDQVPEGRRGQLTIRKLDLREAEGTLTADSVKPGGNPVVAPVADPLRVTPLLLQIEPESTQDRAEARLTRLITRQINATMATVPGVRLFADPSDVHVRVGATRDDDSEWTVTIQYRDSMNRVVTTSHNVTDRLPPKERLRVARGAYARLQTLSAPLLHRRRVQNADPIALLKGGPPDGIGLQLVVNHEPGPDDSIPAYRPGQKLVVGLKAEQDCVYHLVAVRPDGVAETWTARPRPAPSGEKILFPGHGEFRRVENRPGVWTLTLLAAEVDEPSGVPPADTSSWNSHSIRFRVLAPCE